MDHQIEQAAKEIRELVGRELLSIGMFNKVDEDVKKFAAIISRHLSSQWVKVEDRLPDKAEPVVYLRPNLGGRTRFSVGIAYWTVSEKWNPEQESKKCPTGYTHWMPLPAPPQRRGRKQMSQSSD